LAVAGSVGFGPRAGSLRGDVGGAGRQNSVTSYDVGLCSAGWRFASRWCD